MKLEHISMILNISSNFEIKVDYQAWNRDSYIIDKQSGMIIIYIKDQAIGSHNYKENQRFHPVVQMYCRNLGCSVHLRSDHINKFVAHLKLHFREELTLR